MPMRVTPPAGGGEVHPNPFVGDINHTAPIRVLASGLTVAEVDARGYLKPGVLFRRSGALVTAVATAGESIYGANVEAIKIAEGNTGALLTAAGTVTVVVAQHCSINRAILEDSLGRVLTAGELAAAGAAGGGCVVLIY